MKYLCLVQLDEQALQAMPPRELQALTNESLEYNDELARGGHFVAAEALQPAHTATIIRVRNNKLSTTDGPFIETKEQLGGFLLIEARDLNEAIQLASRTPMARVASLEIRPVMELAKALLPEA